MGQGGGRRWCGRAVGRRQTALGRSQAAGREQHARVASKLLPHLNSRSMSDEYRWKGFPPWNTATPSPLSLLPPPAARRMRATKPALVPPCNARRLIL